jgi:hypothetical protein
MGTVESSEFYEYPGKKTIIKIKVHIDVHKPIPTGIHVGNLSDGSCWIDYRYEKLPLTCFRCGLVGHDDKLCKKPPLDLGTLAPLGPWIRSTQYGRRKMEAKDRKFYSNPSHGPNFGQYSPPVPTSLLEQLAAMKLQKTNADTSQQNSQQQPPRHSTHQTYTQEQDRMMTEQNEGQRMNGLGRSHLITNNISSTTNQITPAKRQKMEINFNNDAQSSQHENTRVGHAQLASPGQ